MKKIEICEEDRDAICGILSYDIALNQKAINTGHHPVSGFKFSHWHYNCIERNRELIERLGGNESEIPRIILGYPECKTCMGFGLWAWGDANPMGPMDASDGTPTIACPECGANINPVEDIIEDEK